MTFSELKSLSWSLSFYFWSGLKFLKSILTVTPASSMIWSRSSSIGLSLESSFYFLSRALHFVITIWNQDLLVIDPGESSDDFVFNSILRLGVFANCYFLTLEEADVNFTGLHWCEMSLETHPSRCEAFNFFIEKSLEVGLPLGSLDDLLLVNALGCFVVDIFRSKFGLFRIT